MSSKYSTSIDSPINGQEIQLTIPKNGKLFGTIDLSFNLFCFFFNLQYPSIWHFISLQRSFSSKPGPSK